MKTPQRVMTIRKENQSDELIICFTHLQGSGPSGIIDYAFYMGT